MDTDSKSKWVQGCDELLYLISLALICIGFCTAISFIFTGGYAWITIAEISPEARTPGIGFLYAFAIQISCIIGGIMGSILTWIIWKKVLKRWLAATNQDQ